jgi:hypothetical protein
MNLSGVMKMKQNARQYGACGTAYRLSIAPLSPRTSTKSLSETSFSAAC